MVIIGGGLAGLITAITLKKKGIPVILIEKKHYPFHRVCGEYISNEVIPFLQSLDINPLNSGAVSISKFEISSITGQNNQIALDLGGFGISRYTLDHYLYQFALRLGVEVLHDNVMQVEYLNDKFIIDLKTGNKVESTLVVGGIRETVQFGYEIEPQIFQKTITLYRY